MLCASSAPTWAQFGDYPSRQIQVVVPFPAGGSADYFARSIFNRLAPVIGHPIVMENKAGAGGIIGAKAVIAAPPDGYTLLVSAVASVLVPPHLSTPPAFDALKDLTPVTGIGTVPAVLVVRRHSASRRLRNFSPTRGPIPASSTSRRPAPARSRISPESC
jgi:tripartite-type tricarboxylate transporter receptor subunit TctC